MADDAALRKRRSRAHSRGDHSLCVVGRCEAVTTVTPVPEPPPTWPDDAPDLDAGGRRLWRELGGGDAVGEARVLIVEMCRTVDRCDRLDRQLSSDTNWLSLRMVDDSDEITVIVDRAVGESRQQGLALKQFIAELRAVRAAAAAPAPGSEAAPAAPATAAQHTEEAGNLVDLAAYLAGRA